MDNQQPSSITGEGSETKDCSSDATIECPTTKKRIPLFPIGKTIFGRRYSPNYIVIYSGEQK